MHAQLYPTLCDPMECSPPGSLLMGLSRQEYWSGLSFPPPGNLPDPGIEPGSPAWQVDALLLSHWKSPWYCKCPMAITEQSFLEVGKPSSDPITPRSQPESATNTKMII